MLLPADELPNFIVAINCFINPVLCKLVSFRESAPQLLEDMLEEVKHVTHLRRHHLHVLLTPLLKNWSSHGIGDIFIAFRLLAVRCKVNMHS
jgi:hypothetical protein